jgi:glycosyltransferase involved in cell wall biosynthesis
VTLINLNVNYRGDVGLNRLRALFFLFQKRREHKRKLENLLNKISPDIVISACRSEKNFLPYLNIKSKPIFIKEIHIISNYRAFYRNKYIALFLSKLEYYLSGRKYDKIVVLTEGDKLSNWGNNNKIAVIPNPITSPPIGISTLDNKIAIAVGRLAREKNFSSLISAWKHVKMECPDWQLKIYGNGNMYNSLKKEIHDNKLDDYIYLCGATNHVLEEMQKASLLLLTSWYEGFGLVILEAMGEGIPVISYDCPFGPRTIIEHGKNGFLVPMNDEKGLADFNKR